jgi:hypothetical protein
MLQPERSEVVDQPPSYYAQSQSHDPHTIHLPSAPTTDLPLHQAAPIQHERTLPPLHAVAQVAEPAAEHRYPVWPSTNPLTAYYQPSTHASTSPRSTLTTGMDSPGAMDIDTISTPDSHSRRGASVNADDAAVLNAAEALADLRAGPSSPPDPSKHHADVLDFTKPQHSSPPATSFPFVQTNGSNAQQPEPLLSLLTTSHPLIGTTINSSLSAYSASKNYSPRFKSSAEYVERRFTPVVNTVTSINRATGVEGGVRWFLGGRRPSHHHPDLENGSSPRSKRRKTGGEKDADSGVMPARDAFPYRDALQHRERRLSHASTAESLPAYDDQRSPEYETHALVPTSEDATSPGGTWQSRLILSTSGLSVAMSEESLRSLKYCLGWLRWANEHIGRVISALKEVLEQYDTDGSKSLTNGGELVLRTDAERSELHAKIAELKSDVLKTLKDVVDVVSKYAGGALPENARVLVRKHLTSLPQRFKLASSANTNAALVNGDKSGDGEVREGARRVIVLAKEGLDMMSQVSGVLDGTIVSAEEWCDRLGRKKREEEGLGSKESLPTPSADEERGEVTYREDVKMG